MTYWKKYVRKKWKELRAKYGNVCHYDGCDETSHLEFAHRKTTALNGRGRGTWQRFKDIKNNPTSYILLCHKHHKIFDKFQ